MQTRYSTASSAHGVRFHVVAAVLLWTVTLSAGQGGERHEKVVGRLVEAINAGDYAATRQDFAPAMLDALSAEQAEAFFKDLVTQHGRIVKLGPARVTPPRQAVFPAHFERAVLDIHVVLDERDKIAGLWLRPHREDIPVPEEHETVLRLPFQGPWYVYWGGDTKALNQHHDATNQRFAFDFLIRDDAGKTYRRDASSNEDYYAFGREIQAPAGGLVTDVIEGVRDNRPGSMNPYSALGNAVFIQHAEHEVSVLAHLKLGSIRVKVGDCVRAGHVLGLCGNSGNSSEPHLHYHLQNTPVIQDGTGVKCFFRDIIVTREGERSIRDRYSPVKGDIIERKE